MAKKKNILHRHKSNIMSLFALLVLFLLLALVIPAIGVGASSPAIWVSVVTFFESVKVHVTSYWMFYALIVALLVAYYSKK